MQSIFRVGAGRESKQREYPQRPRAPRHRDRARTPPLDGSQHGLAENAQRDERRDAFLASEGYAVLRFWNYEIVEDVNRVIEVIVRTLDERRPPTRSAARFDLPTGGR